MAEALHVTADEARFVAYTLRQLLPKGTRVWAFGSRATGKGLKPHSDLDLMLDAAGQELPLSTVAALRDAFAESDLPFSVDLIQRCEASAAFLARAEQGGRGLIPLMQDAG